MQRLIIVVLALALAGCITPITVSRDSDHNYSQVFGGMTQPKPEIRHSRLEETSNGDGDWEFEVVASSSWVAAATRGAAESSVEAGFYKQPHSSWWIPNERDFKSYIRPEGHFITTYIFVERNPADAQRIQVFIMRR